MIIQGWKKTALGLIAVGLSLVLLLTAAIPVRDAGPAEKVVKIGIHAVFTGALATTGRAFQGSFDYLDCMNE